MPYFINMKNKRYISGVVGIGYNIAIQHSVINYTIITFVMYSVRIYP